MSDPAGDRSHRINDLGYTLPAGHRLGLIVSSANFPRFERNPNDSEDFFARSAAPLAVTNTVFAGAAQLVLTTSP